MARGNNIVVSSEANGRREEGIIGAGHTPKPGTVMQMDPTVALQSGVHTFVPYNRDADGDRALGPIFILDGDWFQGRLASTAYAAGERCFLYVPQAGDELNMLLLDVAGTGDDHALGEILSIDDGTGKLVAEAGESGPFVLLEAVTDPVADTLLWVRYNGGGG